MGEAQYRLAAVRRVAPGSRLARAFGHRAQAATPGRALGRDRRTLPLTRLRSGVPSAERPCVVSYSLCHQRTSSFHQRILSRSRGAFLRPGFAFLFVPDPERGVGGAPRGALVFPSRVRGATTVLARHGPSRATGRRALHRGDLRTARPRVTCPKVPRTMPRLPAAGPRPRPFGSRSLPAAVAPRFRDATPRSASERLRDAPRERGC
jgi:hypothetical protein